MRDTPKTFVLVHGAWHGAWCWERLVPVLRNRGHQVLTPDLPGHGQDPTPLDKVSLKSAARRLNELLTSLSEPVILVGHSMAGMVISLAAEQMPERIRCLVYLAAFVPGDGDSVFGLMEQQAGSTGAPAIADAMRFSADRRRCHLDAAQASALLYHDCARNDAEWARDRLSEEATLLLSGKVRLSDGKFGQVDKRCLPTRHDRVIPFDHQCRMATRQRCRQLGPLDTDHSPFLSAPAALAEVLHAL